MFTYTVYKILYKGAKPDPTFSFNAKDLDEAISKAKDWGHYHSLIYNEDYVIGIATKHEAANYLHNEYVN